MRSSRRFLRQEALLAGAVAAAVLAALAFLGLVARGDNLLYDQLVQAAPLPPANRIVIVAIDEPSLGTIGRWPWRRSLHAALLDRLRADGAKAVGYDVLFDQPSADDPLLVHAMRGMPTVLPVGFLVPGEMGSPFTPQPPVGPIAGAAAGVGQAAVAFDEDGIVRSTALVAGGGARRWPHVAELLHRAAFGRPSPAFLRLAGAALPADRFSLGEPVLVPLPHGRFATIAFDAVLRGEAPPGLFRDRIVLVGQTAPGSGDHYAVAGNAGAMPGVELLANVTAALVADELIQPAGEMPAYLLAAAALAFFVAALLAWSPRINFVLGLGLMAALVGLAALLLRYAGLWLSPAPALIALATVYPLWGWRRLAATSRYMARELARLDREPDVLMREIEGAPHAGDVIEDQITLLNRAIDRVRDLSRFLDGSLQSLPDPTLVVDADGVVLMANQAADALFADAGASPAGTPLATLMALLAPDAPTLLSATEQEFATRDGRIFTARMAARIGLDDRSGGWICRLTDITAIRVATRQREQALQLLTHDMRSPQASILALLESGGEPAALAPRIARHAQRTLDLADGFVQLARAENANYAAEPVDLAAMVVEAADDQWALAQRRHIHVECRYDSREHLVLGDRSLLCRVLVNLVNNAVKHSPDGGVVTCTVRSPEPAPDGDSSSMVRCDIEDRGPGIHDGEADAIFAAFRTGTQRAATAGVGLGLAFVGTVVRRHGGTIQCANREGGGAHFSLWLPLEDEPLPPD
ncbi:CHASE2 and HATPase_c domain-containing protein [Sphingomonas nostoxanthinifaciens]|uniref:CHASE2 and HATPase_c domain-containing protein n=1 Tax=Sphingomonas nostoxanthinifaciens TaxID=2872652 RepID=UPI001CC1F040|nr:CHASE2 and HATPase_c domain-containing protein [Sphingomonas nostoxanthinifaciens]UAK23060.1 CHASE2 domain-containing protein [Sphingomonas nostoxanthinifaciens]